MATKQLAATGVLFTDRRDFYISPNVVKEKWASVAPFLTVVAAQRTVSGFADPVYKMFQHTNPWETQKFSNNGSTDTIPKDNTESAAISIDGITGLVATVDDSYEGLLVEVWDSDEVTFKGAAIITDATSGTSIKLKSMRNATIVLVDNDVFIVYGNARGEGTESPEPWADELTIVYNSAQIMRTPLAITGTLMEAALRGERSELIRLRLQKSAESKFQAEMSMLRGYGTIGTNLGGTDTFTDAIGGNAQWRSDGTGAKIRATTGAIAALREYGNTDVTDVNQNHFEINKGLFTQSDFNALSQKVFNIVPGSGVKEMFCGASMMTYWSNLTAAKKDSWEINISDMKRDRLGFNFKWLDTPNGILKLINTPALRGPYAGYGLVISKENMFHAIYRAPEFRAAILSKSSANAPDMVKDEYFRDEGIGMTNLSFHHLLRLV